MADHNSLTFPGEWPPWLNLANCHWNLNITIITCCFLTGLLFQIYFQSRSASPSDQDIELMLITKFKTNICILFEVQGYLFPTLTWLQTFGESEEYTEQHATNPSWDGITTIVLRDFNNRTNDEIYTRASNHTDACWHKNEIHMKFTS